MEDLEILGNQCLQSRKETCLKSDASLVIRARVRTMYHRYPQGNANNISRPTSREHHLSQGSVVFSPRPTIIHYALWHPCDKAWSSASSTEKRARSKATGCRFRSIRAIQSRDVVLQLRRARSRTRKCIADHRTNCEVHN